MLRGPLTGLLACVCLALLVTWIPYYLCWPWWPDLDAYAAMAQAWDAGEVPYRDLSAFNFPGQIYVFWMLGKALRLGPHGPDLRPRRDPAVDRRGRSSRLEPTQPRGILPGVVGYAASLQYYLGLSCSLVVQRDWHAGASR